MNRNPTLAAALLLLVIVLVFALAHSGRTPVVATTVSYGYACAANMRDVIASAQESVYNMEGETDFSEPESYYLAYYSIENGRLANPSFGSVPPNLRDEQGNANLQNQSWEMFSALIPAEDREMVAQFNVFTDGYSNTLAAVDQVRENPSQWVLEIDIADLEDRDSLTFTLIHEYAHILTLNASQMEPDQDIVNDPMNIDLQKQKAAACPNYFTGMGCSHADSYIQAFYDRFWVAINDEWAAVDALQHNTSDFIPHYDGLYEFYLDHQDQFLDDYSVTHPAEDIAEAFTYFVFNPKPAGDSIAEQKVSFFYEYPELVELRASILESFCASIP